MDHTKDEEDYGVLIIYEIKGFNKVNFYVMLWDVRYHWPMGERFIFNCYQLWSVLVIHEGEWMTIMEVVTQADSLSMVLYGIGILQLVKRLLL